MMPRITFRCPPKLHAKAEELAAKLGMSVGEFTRKCLEDAAGVHVEVKRGIAGADVETRERVEEKRLNGIKRRARARKKKDA